MDGGGSAGGGGEPAPFLLKTYEMVDDASTDAIVSWSAKKNSFVVWNPPEFSRLLLPMYFKHNNFSSFIRQLNTYGFRKIDPERWEFANEDFVKDQKHLLKNIYRRKPIHSHTQPPASADSERAAFEEEIDKLTREKIALEGDLLSYKEQNSAGKAELEELTPKIALIKQRQERLSSFFEMALQNPDVLERLARKLESVDFSADSKKRRVSEVEHEQPNQENLLIESHSNSITDFGNIPQLDFFNKPRIELSTAVSDINLLSHSTQSSNEDGVSPQGRTGGWSNDAQAITSLPDTLELSDTETSFTLKIDSSLPCKAMPESQRAHSFQRSPALNDECDAHISCLLNLTLAPSSPPLELNKSPSPSEVPPSSQEIGTVTGHNSGGDESIQSDQEKDQTPPNAHKPRSGTGHSGVNDIFWEQFLTERPGCSDTEEASSSFRANPSDEQQEERKQSKGVSGNTKGMEHLSL